MGERGGGIFQFCAVFASDYLHTDLSKPEPAGSKAATVSKLNFVLFTLSDINDVRKEAAAV